MKTTIAVINLDNTGFMIQASTHASERMTERNVTKNVIAESISSLGRDKLVHLQETKEQAIVINSQENISVVFAVKNYRIEIITVIDKSNVFVKRNTAIINV